MSLMGCPIEILYNILNYVEERTDVVSIALCSLFLSSLVELRLKPVCEILGDDPESKTYQTPSQLLCTLLSNPSRAPYIGTLKCFRYNVNGGSGIKMKDHTKNIQDAIKSRPYIHAKGYDFWCNCLLAGHPDFALALLFTLLPNLQHLHIWNPLLETSRMIQTIAIRDDGARPKLTSASFEDTDQNQWGLACMPSMRNLRIHYEMGFSRRRLNIPSFLEETPDSFVENVDLRMQCVQEPDLLRFLRKLKHLRRFHFETGDTPLEDDRNRLFPKICRALLEAAGATLKSLKLKDNRHHPDSGQRPTATSSIGSLKHFEQLKIMEIDEIIITGTLLDILPESAEQFVLLKNDRCWWRDPIALFKELPTQKTKRWPRLSSITYDRPFPGSQERTYGDLGVASREVQYEDS